MSISLSICFLLSAAIIKIQSAPKLGHILFDPLSYETKLTRGSKEISNSREDWLEEYLRMPMQGENTTKKLCSGYDYDETLCKTVDDRVVCGYNKNKGNISDKISELGNGCRIRAGRLECGYLVGPFNNPRRPPARDSINDSDGKSLSLRHGPTRSSRMTTDPVRKSTHNQNVTISKRFVSVLSRSPIPKISIKNTTNRFISTTKRLPIILPTVKTSFVNNFTSIITSHANLSLVYRRQYNATKFKRHCVEKKDRIFCYFIKD